jgi:hypothetical protein
MIVADLADAGYCEDCTQNIFEPLKLLWYFHSFWPNVLSAAVELIGPLIQPVTDVESILLDFDRSLLCYGKQYIFQVECSVPFLSMCDKIDDCNI